MGSRAEEVRGGGQRPAVVVGGLEVGLEAVKTEIFLPFRMNPPHRRFGVRFRCVTSANHPSRLKLDDSIRDGSLSSNPASQTSVQLIHTTMGRPLKFSEPVG